MTHQDVATEQVLDPAGRQVRMVGPMPNLDLVRAFAVGLVLFDHTCLALQRPFLGTWEVGWAGVFGVYLFFLHTSLVLMWSLERQPHVLNFYIRRAFRLYPLAIVAVCAALLFRLEALAGGVFVPLPHYSWRVIAGNLLLIQDTFHRPNIIGVMWSLTLEMRMYLILPVLFFFAARVRRLWPLLVLWVVAVIEAKPFALVGNLLPTVLPNFLAGVIAYVAYQRLRPKLAAGLLAPLLLVALALYMVRPGVRVSWPIVLVVALLLPLFRQIRMRAVVRGAHLVAEYSYGIYLGHPFAIALGFYTLRGWNPWLQVAVEFTTTALIAWVGYHLIEGPMIRMGRRVAVFEDQEHRPA